MNYSLGFDNFKFEADLKKSFLDFKTRKLSINSTCIQYDGKSILCNTVKAIKYGSIQMYVNGIKANRIYEFQLLNNNNEKIRITFSSVSFLKKKNKDYEKLYLDIINALWNSVTKRLMFNYLEEIKNGKSIVIGNCEVNSKGLNLGVYRWFKLKKYFVPWSECLKTSHNGFLILYSKNNNKIKCRVNFLKEWNSVVLYSLLNYLWEDGRAYNLSIK